MLDILKKLNFELEKSSYLKFIFLSYLIIFFCYLLPSLIIENIFNIQPFNENPIADIPNKFVIFFLTVIVAPIIETLIFQIFLIKGFYIFLFIFLSEKVKESKIKIVSIILSSLIFGIIHYYSIFYVIAMFILGLFFGMIYFYSERKNIRPFLPIAITHSLYNLSVLLLGIFFNI